MKKYFKISFFSIILIMLITFIPNVSADTSNTDVKCVYSFEDGKISVDAVFELDTTNKKIKSVKTNGKSSNPQYSYSEIFDGEHCKDVTIYFRKFTWQSDDATYLISKNKTSDADRQLKLNKSKSEGNKAQTSGKKDDDPKKDDGSDIKDQFLGNTTCGGITSFTFPDILPKITSSLYNLLKVAVPVILIIKGMLDMFKAATSQKEDEMKKAQKKFVQRLIAGILALLVFIIVETIISFIAKGTGNDNAWGCVDCFINNKCK